MKKIIATVLCLVLVFSLASCGNNDQSSDTHDANYEEGYTAGYEAGYNDGKQQMTEPQKCYAQFSGSFTATVEQLLPDYCALGKNDCRSSLLSDCTLFTSLSGRYDRKAC